MLRYIELKTGYQDDGPAWIGHVETSRSGRTIYFNGKAFKRTTMGVSGNYYDVETREEYWISGVKKDGLDRHWAGSGKVVIERAAIEDYLATIGASELDTTRFIVSDAIKPTNRMRFHDLENPDSDA